MLERRTFVLGLAMTPVTPSDAQAHNIKKKFNPKFAPQPEPAVFAGTNSK